MSTVLKTKEGKEFEVDFANSFPKNVWYYRIPDTSNSFSGGNASRFTNKSKYDFMCYTPNHKKPQLYGLELKSTKSSSITTCDYKSILQYEMAIQEYNRYRNSLSSKRTDKQKETVKEMKQICKMLYHKLNSKSIKYHQIKSLKEDNDHGLKCYLILNFRKYEVTYAIDIDSFLKVIKESGKKSINIEDIAPYSCEIYQEKIRNTKHWKYYMEEIGIYEEK